ncbi:Serine/threonine-protein phosphatase 2A 56 kDa regulatory subunit delta isoform [Smittium mucronatum]|uniref:Serine/threonine-protein phosphatase 2A 56 kDa regulatory subunit n=1 Tax=Smittium mucronatum TaxID=133383 RepID=A0A1R0H1V8_9FUNG|nr:Serine/threonine-protein phosphatase 2A 56 kDa regulatory subunit delta isoform [Smittium mucronatum]
MPPNDVVSKTSSSSRPNSDPPLNTLSTDRPVLKTPSLSVTQAPEGSPVNSAEPYRDPRSISPILVDEIQTVKTLRKQRSIQMSPLSRKEFKVFPKIEDLSNSNSDKLKLFCKKVDHCSIVVDFCNEATSIELKNAKRNALEQIIDYLGKYHIPKNEALYRQIIKMISSNIFRNISSQSGINGEPFDPEEDDPYLEPSWPHLELVYVFFLRFLESDSFDEYIARKFINQKFILQLLVLFNTEDPRERETLKTILHRIYGKILLLRSFIRKSINDIFLQFVYENEPFNGITQLLEIMGSIINGFTVPLKEEHKVFLCNVLLPLHKARPISTYHPQLAYCTVQFIEKDPTLSEPIVMSLLRYWPKTNSPKEVMFLSEVEEILDVIGVSEFQKVHIPLFQKVSQCVFSPHFQVAERALSFWRNDHVIHLIYSSLDTIMHVVLNEVYKACKSHWNQSVHQNAYAVFRFFMLSDDQLFDSCIENLRVSHIQNLSNAASRKLAWLNIQRSVALNHPDQKYTTPPALSNIGNSGADSSVIDRLDMIIDNILQENASPNDYSNHSPNLSNQNISSNSSQSVPFYDSYQDISFSFPINSKPSLTQADMPPRFYDSS